jgi:hypothetical protein
MTKPQRIDQSVNRNLKRPPSLLLIENASLRSPSDSSKALNDLKDASGVCVISFKELMDVSLRLRWETG